MHLTRRQLLAGGAGALGAAGIYGLVDRFARAPSRAPVAAALPPEQHVLEGLSVVVDNDVEVVVPPLHSEVVTGILEVDPAAHALRDARQALEDVLAQLERGFEPGPAGLSLLVAWGLPYFNRYVPGPAEDFLPVDVRASKAAGTQVRALLDAIRFPSDPDDLLLESNEVAFLLRSDRLDVVAEASRALLRELDGIVRPTSIRRGFIGGGFGGARGLPKRMALAAGLEGAELIPETAELFLGFTSTQKAAPGPPRIANHETLPGYTDQWPDGYFREGTAMHLSHIFEDLAGWYLNADFSERLTTMFSPDRRAAEGTTTIPQGRGGVATPRDLARDVARHGRFGHSTSIQPTSRLQADVVGRDGTRYAGGTAIPQRADFNTLDNPFTWSSRPERDRQSSAPAAGVHFVVFNPTSDDFHRNRLAMDGVLPDGTVLAADVASRGQGFNSFLSATHRQNFLVPPRRHRSFPLAEFL